MNQTSRIHAAQLVFAQGKDVASLFQQMFTSAVDRLDPGHWQFSAWLDAQGRTRYVFQLARLAPERWMLLLRGGSAIACRDELARYVFRADVRLNADDSRGLKTTGMRVLYAADETSGCIALGGGDHAVAITADPADADDGWRLAQCHAGWPWLEEHALGLHVAPSLGLERLGALSLDKGCYPGQEIVARLHFRDASKRQLARVELSQRPGNAAQPSVDDQGNTWHWLQVVDHDDGIAALTVCPRGIQPGQSWPLRDGEGHPITVRVVEAWPPSGHGANVSVT